MIYVMLYSGDEPRKVKAVGNFIPSEDAWTNYIAEPLTGQERAAMPMPVAPEQARYFNSITREWSTGEL